jgi:hypothetical protein
MDVTSQPKLVAPVLRRPGTVQKYQRRFSMAPAVTITRAAISQRAGAPLLDRSVIHRDASRTERAPATAAGVDTPSGRDDLR